MKKTIVLILSILMLLIVFALAAIYIYKESDTLFRKNSLVIGTGFDKKSIVTSEGVKAKVSSSGRILSFETPEFSEVGSSATVMFKVVNNSNKTVTLGMPALSCFFVDEELKFLQITPATNLDSAVITNNSISEESSVVVRQIKNYKGSDNKNIKFQCALNVAIQE